MAPGDPSVTVICPVTSSLPGNITIRITPVAPGTLKIVAGVVGLDFDPVMTNNSTPVHVTTVTGNPPPVPTGLVATATSVTQVSVGWNASAGATSYQLERSSSGSPYALIASPSASPYLDTSVTAGTTYLYRVKAVGPGGTSAPSNIDLATTILFLDDPIQVQSTVVKAQHVTEARQAVNAVRAAASLSAASWTDSPLSGGGVTLIKKDHIDELRGALTQARAALGFSNPDFTDPTITAQSTIIKAVHVEQLRARTK
jgi:hypothetical protein